MISRSDPKKPVGWRRVLGAKLPISVSVDSGRLRANYVFSGPVTGDEFLAVMAETLAAHPELADCDAICDVTDYTGDVTTDHMAGVAMLMNELRENDRPVRTALVARDGGFLHWAEVMNHQFDGRHFRVFESTGAAAAWIGGVQLGHEAA
jgi:hypothetical protein